MALRQSHSPPRRQDRAQRADDGPHVQRRQHRARSNSVSTSWDCDSCCANPASPLASVKCGKPAWDFAE
jgi:hypothetical protein